MKVASRPTESSQNRVSVTSRACQALRRTAAIGLAAASLVSPIFGQADTVAVVIEGQVTARETLWLPPGVPLAGARVDLASNGTTLSTTTTDDRGAFSLRVSLAPGDYSIETSCRGTVSDLDGSARRPFGSERKTSDLGLVGVGTRTRDLRVTGDLNKSRTQFAWVDLSCVEPSRLASNDPQLRAEPGPDAVRPWHETISEDESPTVTVYYATDRGPLPRRTGRYNNERNESGALSFGRLRIRIPPTHRLAKIERPWFWRLEDPRKDFVITRRTNDDYQAFYRELRDHVQKASRRDAFVFIHGYRTSFDEAAYRTAQLAHDLSFEGAPIMYSWPSADALIPYPHDLTNSERTIPALRYFLNDLAEKTAAERIHLIAHSRGTYALTRAVSELVNRSGAPFKEVILLAPDIDAVVFREQIAPAIVGTGQRVTLYASSRNRALRMSKGFNGGDRAGDSFSPLIVQGIDTIDATSVETDWWGHDPIVPSVLWDIFDLLRSGSPPSQRFGLKPKRSSDGRPFWVFKPVASR
jgi:esterase/lipase superfamily enzyme